MNKLLKCSETVSSSSNRDKNLLHRVVVRNEITYENFLVQKTSLNKFYLLPSSPWSPLRKYGNYQRLSKILYAIKFERGEITSSFHNGPGTLQQEDETWPETWKNKKGLIRWGWRNMYKESVEVKLPIVPRSRSGEKQTTLFWWT